MVRECKSLFRSNFPYYFLIFYVILHSLIFSGVVSSLLHGVGISEWMLKQAGRELGGRLFGTQLILILIVSPFLSIKLMAREREEAMMELLQILPEGYFKIMTWKFLTFIFIWLTLIFLILPLFLFSLSLGGVSSKELGIMLSIALGFILFCGGISLFWISVLYNPDYSLVATYTTVFVITGISIYLYYHYSLLPIFFELLSYSF